MKLAHKSGWLHFPHTHKTALSEAGTQAFYDGVPLHKCEAEDDADHTFSSVVIVPRDLYEEVGGYDERFVGWGWEDLAFFWACATMAGYDRVGGAVYHLWHPQSRADTYESPHYRANEELGHRYMEAKWNQTKMRSLLTEDRTSADGSTSTAG
jgi:predicted glycosyltransferase involved in capsule biosynthesis